MQLTYLLVAGAGIVSALPARDVHVWLPPSPSARRSPCPMLNALANHGFLPRSGLNVSMDDLVTGLSDSIHLAAAATQFVGAKALSTSTTGNASTFNLDDLNTHHILEHDGSLSRNDIYFGDNHSFNPLIWAQSTSYFPNSTITVSNAASARAARIATMEKTNPVFNMTAGERSNSFIESALYLGTLGNVTTGNVRRDFVEVLFTQERLPYLEGWTRSAVEITAAHVVALVGLLSAAST